METAADPQRDGVTARPGADGGEPVRSGADGGGPERSVGRQPATLAHYVSSQGYSAAGTALPESGRRRSRRGEYSRRRLIALGLVLPITLLAAWFAVSALGLLPAYRLPSPASVVQAAVDLAVTGQLGIHIAISVQRVLLGFAIGALLGLAVGSLVGLSRLASALLAPLIGALRAVPSLAWLPLLVLYVGINEDQKVTLLAIGAFFPVFTTVAGALGHVDPHLVEAGRAFGLRGIRLLAAVQLPAVVPSVVSGLRLALAQTWLFLVAAEIAASSVGLGFLLVDSQNNGRLDRMFLAIILLGVLGKTTDALIGVLERRLLSRWT